MTASTLPAYADLVYALAGPDGVPRSSDDPRLPGLYVQGRIDLRVDSDGREVWRWNVRARIPGQRLSPEQREVVADEAAWKRRDDV